MIKPLFTTLYSLVAISALTLLLAPNAFATGTASGIDITNSASVDYEVGGVNQNDITSNIVTFKVDALVDLTVTGSTDVNGTPGSVYALAFTVTNTGNETYDFNLAFEAGTAAFNVADLAIHVDTNNNGVWDGVGTDLAGTSLNNILADASTLVWLVGTIPATATDNQTAAYRLMATTQRTDGSAIPAETADVVATKQYVYADGAGPHSGDNANDTQHSASLSFIAQTASLSIVKSSTVIWDPVNLATNPLHIPGAIVEYTIQIENSTGAETANAIVITDVLDSNLAVPTTIPAEITGYTTGNSIARTTPNLNSGAIEYLADTATVSGQTVTVTGIVLLGGESATVNVLAKIQ